jgi:HAD superfamily hydrolase (TIGR01484 family)
MTHDHYKLLALDVDGTILNSAHQLTEKVRATLFQLTQQGIHVILASARSPQSMTGFIEQIGLNGMYVALNGALVVGPNRESLHHFPMAYDDIQTILWMCEHYQLTANLFAGFDWYVEQSNDMVEQQVAIVGFSPDPPTLSLFYDQLGHSQTAVNATLSKPTHCEVTAANVTKASGLTYICQQLDLPPSAVVAIGDNFNDLDMLDFAGLGVAMGNSPEQVKAKANLVIGSNDEDGVADFVQEMFLLP